MLEPHAGEHLHLRGDHVGGVIAPAETRLDHRHLDLATSELGVGGGGQGLELGHAIVPVQRAVHELGRAGGAGHRGREVSRLEVGILDPDPLPERDQVRRDVDAGAQAVMRQNRGDHARGRGLAVGPNHVDRRELPLRMPERGHQSAHAVQPEPHPEQLERQQVALRLLGSHGSPSSAGPGVTGAPAPPARESPEPQLRRPGSHRSPSSAGPGVTGAPARPAGQRACRARPGPHPPAPWTQSPDWPACVARARSRLPA